MLAFLLLFWDADASFAMIAAAQPGRCMGVLAEREMLYSCTLSF